MEVEMTSCVYWETRFSKDSLWKGVPKEHVGRTSGVSSRNRKMVLPQFIYEQSLFIYVYEAVKTFSKEYSLWYSSLSGQKTVATAAGRQTTERIGKSQLTDTSLKSRFFLKDLLISFWLNVLQYTVSHIKLLNSSSFKNNFLINAEQLECFWNFSLW